MYCIDGSEYAQLSQGFALARARTDAVNFSIPEKIKGTPVVMISGNAFFGCKNLKKVTIPHTVVAIGVNAFRGCGNLRHVVAESQLLILQEGAFSGCYRLCDFTANEVMLSGEAVFCGCTKLKELNCKFKSVIPNRTFYGCAKLEKIHCDNGIVINDAFSRCMDFKEIEFDGDATISEKALLFVKKRTLICPEYSQLAELAFAGSNVVFKN